jgi:hypothetical protein
MTAGAMSSRATGRSLLLAAFDRVAGARFPARPARRGPPLGAFTAGPDLADRRNPLVGAAVAATAPAAPAGGSTGVVWLPCDVTTTALSFACGGGWML